MDYYYLRYNLFNSYDEEISSLLINSIQEEDELRYIEHIQSFLDFNITDSDRIFYNEEDIHNLETYVYIEGMMSSTLHESSVDFCVICQENYKNDDILIKMGNCFHTFHKNCIRNYLYYNLGLKRKCEMKCFLCRKNIFLGDD